MRKNDKEKLIEILTGFISKTAIDLPDDVVKKLDQLSALEKGERAALFYRAMEEDLAMAGTLRRPCCQDTGVLQFLVHVGTGFPLRDEVEAALIEASLRATEQTPLRPNCVETFEEVNTGNNRGYRIPWIDWKLVARNDSLEIDLYLAGGGCSLPGKAMVLMPADGYAGVVRFVFDQIASYGVNACPPLLVGVGIAATADMAAKLSKLALLRPIGSANPVARVHALEEEIEKGLNSLKLGPGGVGGQRSVMGVHIEQAGRHPATLAVGLSTGCWAHRRAKIIISPRLGWDMVSHKGDYRG